MRNVLFVLATLALAACGEDAVGNLNDNHQPRGRCEADVDCADIVGATCDTDSGMCMKTIEKVVEKQVTVAATCSTNEDCNKLESGAVCQSNGICYRHTSERVIIDQPVEVPKVCETDADCEAIESGAICKSNGICYKQTNDTEVVYGGCTNNVQCHDGRTCAEGFCVMPTVCGTEQVYSDTDGQYHTIALDGTIEFELRPDGFEGIDGSKLPTDGDNVLPLLIRAGQDGTCKKSILTGLNFSVYQNFLPNVPAVMPQFKVMNQQGNQLGNALYLWREVHNGTWIEYDFRWTGALEVQPGHTESFNVICTNCSRLPAHTAFYTMTERQYKYKIEGSTAEQVILDEQIDRMMIYGNLTNTGFTCGTIMKPDGTPQVVGSKVTPSLSGSSPYGQSVRSANQRMYEVQFNPVYLSICQPAMVTELNFKVYSEANLAGLRWKLVDEYNNNLVTTSTFVEGTGSLQFLISTYPSAAFVVSADPRALTRVIRLVADTSSLPSGADLTIQHDGAFSWMNLGTSETHTTHNTLPQKTFWYQ